MSDKERGFYEAGLTGQLAGTEEEVERELEAVLKDTGAQEVLVTTSTYDREALLDSYRRLAALAGLDGSARAGEHTGAPRGERGRGATRGPGPGCHGRGPGRRGPGGRARRSSPSRPRCAPCAPGRARSRS